MKTNVSQLDKAWQAAERGELEPPQLLNLLDRTTRFLAMRGVEIRGERVEAAYRDLYKKGKAGSTGFNKEAFAELHAQLSDLPLQEAIAQREVRPGLSDTATNWNCLHGGPTQDGTSPDAGPAHGRIAWTLPVGRAWEGRVAVESGRVYAASPSLAHICFCFDERSGVVLWRAEQRFDGHQYGTPRMHSSVVIVGDQLLMREVGSGGNKGCAKHVCYLDKATGKLLRKFAAGHIDYRVGVAPFAADANYVVVPTGVQEIGLGGGSPEVNVFDRVSIRRLADGEELLSCEVGLTFSEPVIAGRYTLVPTLDGTLYCFELGETPELSWKQTLNGAITNTVAVGDGKVYVIDDSGIFSILELETGAILEQSKPLAVNANAFRKFSTPCVTGDAVVIASASCEVIKFCRQSARILASAPLEDWGRSRPLFAFGRLWAADLSGTLYCFDRDLNPVASKKISEFGVFADLTAGEDCILVSTADVWLHAVETDLSQRWQQPLLETAEVDGEKVFVDFDAGGGDYQSTPIVADGRVFIGTPARSVCAADVNTGQLLWRFETRGQVSAAPVHADGKIFFGQHGGTGDFYCVDAGSGELLWTQNLGWVWASATPFAGRLIVPAVNGNIYCLDQADGRILWRFYTGTGCYPAPAIEDGKVLAGSWNGYYYLLDLETGEERWRFDTRGNPDSGAALMRDGRAYIQALYGRAFYCLDAETGAEIWSFEYPEGWHCNVSPALADGKIVLSTFYYGAVCDFPIAPCLYCLDAATGELLWQARGDGGITGHAVAGGRLYSGSSCTPWFTCRDLETGEILWRCKMGGRCEETCATIYGKHAFILVTDGRLYAFA